MTRKRVEALPVNDRRKWEVWRAADQIRAEGKERVALRNVWARVKRNAGVAGNNQCVGEHLSQWAEDRRYSPVVELAGMPDKVSAHLAKAGVELWGAAQAEAATILEREHLRMAEAVETERELRYEALGMLDAREVVIEAQRAEIARLAGELERSKRHLQTVRAREFWRRVAHEIWEILPEREALHLNDIAQRVGREVVKEAEEYPGEWGRNCFVACSISGSSTGSFSRARAAGAIADGEPRTTRPEPVRPRDPLRPGHGVDPSMPHRRLGVSV